ncbi:MAG TPA: flagellar export chaperone FlgN [Candidatus Krumholzibacteria bacterium]|nr:flagellar export chaperone FlgN [Candidatus Krumholzibacteria bacterium]HPD71656.1 flagellar export chaperone FlgN [Candidatus Krumholzibacteria bacterium]HRY41411.1 flagellar export chaperone FlgN [Candidatus Krumholzibacteria bacterium]
MAETTASAAVATTETLARHLQEVLAEEQRHYAQLTELARQQGQLMTTHDLEGLEDNARRMTEGLTVADAVRIQRERLAQALMAGAGTSGPTSLSAWLAGQDLTVRQVLTEPVQAVRRTAGELARANELNRRLANFCLDLVEEEAALLRRGLLEDPAGRYDRGAQPACNEQGGTLVRQA